MILRFLFKTIVREFYRQNVGFIFLVLMFAGSFLRANEHIELGKLAVHLPLILATYCLIWTIYAIKVTLFSLRFLENPQNQLLYHLRLVPNTRRFFIFILIQIALYALAFVYAIFVMYLAIKEHSWWAVLSIFFVNSFLILLGVYAFVYKLKRPNEDKIILPFSQYFSKHFNTPYLLFFIRFLIEKDTILLFSTKLFNGFFIYGICKLYPTDAYDERLFSLMGLLVAAINVIILIRQFEFENHFLSLLKNLPLSIPYRFFQYGIILFILLLPEFIVLFHYLPTQISAFFYAQVCLLIFSLNLLIISILFTNIPQEKLLIRVFYGGIFCFFVVMFRLPILLMSVSFIIVSYLIFKRNYFKTSKSVQ